MTDYTIAEMTQADLDRLNDKHRSLPYFTPRTEGFKLLLRGEWFYGFRSRQQAEWAVANKS